MDVDQIFLLLVITDCSLHFGSTALLFIKLGIFKLEMISEKIVIENATQFSIA